MDTQCAHQLPGSCLSVNKSNAKSKVKLLPEKTPDRSEPRAAKVVMGSFEMVAIGEQLVRKLNGSMSILMKSGLEDKHMEEVIYLVPPVEESTPIFILSHFLSEVKIRSSSSGSLQQNRSCCNLLKEFTVILEKKLIRREQAYSDAGTIRLLPFRSIQKDYLPNMSFFVFEASFPSHLRSKLDAVLLLFTRVLCKSLEEILILLQCEYQAVVLHDFSAHLVTENHAIEALVKVSQVNSCNIFFIVGYSPEKCSTEIIKTMKTNIKSNFNAQFLSESFTIDLLDGQHAPLTDPTSEQTVKQGVQESETSSSQHDAEAPLVAGIVYSSLQHQFPAANCRSAKFTYSNNEIQNNY